MIPRDVCCLRTVVLASGRRALFGSLAVLFCGQVAAFSIGGSVTGMPPQGAQLTRYSGNGDEVLAIPGGASAYAFVADVQSGSAHRVAVTLQPPGYTCRVTRRDVFSVSGNVTDVNVICIPGSSIGGRDFDFPSGLVLQSGSLIATELDVTPAGWGPRSFDFPQPLQPGESYDVFVAAQPAGFHCIVRNGTGEMGATAVTNIGVRCIATNGCVADVDDDGRVRASTDGLIVQRVLQGVRGESVLSGARDTHARRSTWPQIRDFFNQRCGMNLP
jgi:hypothetical protein